MVPQVFTYAKTYQTVYFTYVQFTAYQLHLNTTSFLGGIASRSSLCGSLVMNSTSIHEDVGLIPGPTQWAKDPALL